MSPTEGALPQLNLWVRRPRRTVGLGPDRSSPAEAWGCTAQQALETLLQAKIVLGDRQPLRSRKRGDLAQLAGLQLIPRPPELQVFAGEPRYAEGPFPLPAEREVWLSNLAELLDRGEAAGEAATEAER